MIKCGTDLIRVQRIKKACSRLGEPFLRRIWTEKEIEDCMPDGVLSDRAAASLAARFAAKEAIAKALGTGIGQSGIQWTHIWVEKIDSGAPVPRLTGAALTYFINLGGTDIALSISHENEYAQAFCVICHTQADQRDALTHITTKD